MAAVIKESARVYQHVMNELADPRTAGWFLASSPWPMIAILVIYLYLVKKAGPRYMKDREAYELRKSMLVYNVIQILFSVYLVYEALMSGWWDDYSYRCQPIDFSDNPKAVRMARACWCYMICKVVELLDTVSVIVLILQVFFVLRKKSNQISYLHLYHHTFMPVCSWIGVKFFAGVIVLILQVFFVLRKKSNQISYLHLYHHTLMPVCSWIGVKFLPGGHGTLLGLINSFVHIIMYSYYLFAGLGPRFQKYLWWKKHLTTMQMVRFQYSRLGVDLVSIEVDPRTNHWALVSSPVPVVLILLGYLYIVNKWGIQFMKNREPYELKNVIIFFNITQILFNVWMFYEALQGGWLYEYNWRCQPVDRSNSPTALRMASVCWWYLVCKLVDLLDTVFFVLRKKNGHVSYLHVHHHFSMPAVSWVCVKYHPGGHGTMVGLLNTLVHIIMYSYYLISSLGPQYQKYLWWKKYLTMAQMYLSSHTPVYEKYTKSLYGTVRFTVPATWCLTVTHIGDGWGGSFFFSACVVFKNRKTLTMALHPQEISSVTNKHFSTKDSFVYSLMTLLLDEGRLVANRTVNCSSCSSTVHPGKHLVPASTQFLIIIFHTGQILFTDCDYTKFCNAYLFFNSIFFFAMFASFYRKTYLVQKNQIKPD
uniref:Elongation of very long chain fatty acids protein n=1 Tax=Timema monikensis TaxID=170555 RepID=A0A7R9EHH4_9NEOP|nr:unnamed protein product [Timema monikensis]